LALSLEEYVLGSGNENNEFQKILHDLVIMGTALNGVEGMSHE